MNKVFVVTDIEIIHIVPQIHFHRKFVNHVKKWLSPFMKDHFITNMVINKITNRL